MPHPTIPCHAMQGDGALPHNDRVTPSPTGSPGALPSLTWGSHPEPWKRPWDVSVPYRMLAYGANAQGAHGPLCELGYGAFPGRKPL